MIPRLLPLSVALVLASAALSGCTPQPAPTPTPTGFATEDEAFAAAEETYRAYVDALNQVDLSDPETFEPVYAWTTGEANAGARKTFTQMHADQWTVTGVSEFDNFTPTDFSPGKAAATVTAELCLDVTAVMVTDADGQSVVPSTRKDRQAAIVTFDASATRSGLAIASSEAKDDATCG